MRTVMFLVVCGLAILVEGCVRSLHPLYTEENLVFEAALVGTWIEDEDGDTWIFMKSGDKAYELVVTENGAPAKFDAHLVQLGAFQFLDLYPREPDLENDFYKFPVHTFSRIWIEEDAMRLSMLDNDWLEDMIEQEKVSIAHERSEEGLLVTAPTEDLQQLVVQYAEDEKAFPQPGEMRRLH